MTVIFAFIDDLMPFLSFDMKKIISIEADCLTNGATHSNDGSSLESDLRHFHTSMVDHLVDRLSD